MGRSNKIREEILRMYSDACDEVKILSGEGHDYWYDYRYDYSHGYVDGKLETLAVLSIVAGIPASVMKSIKKPFGTEEETSNGKPCKD